MHTHATECHCCCCCSYCCSFFPFFPLFMVLFELYHQMNHQHSINTVLVQLHFFSLQYYCINNVPRFFPRWRQHSFLLKHWTKAERRLWCDRAKNKIKFFKRFVCCYCCCYCSSINTVNFYCIYFWKLKWREAKNACPTLRWISLCFLLPRFFVLLCIVLISTQETKKNSLSSFSV